MKCFPKRKNVIPTANFEKTKKPIGFMDRLADLCLLLEHDVDQNGINAAESQRAGLTVHFKFQVLYP